jgi:hypothetical protein
MLIKFFARGGGRGLTGDHETAYISIDGQPSPEQWAVLETALLSKQAQGAVLVVGADADAAGDRLAE